MTIQEVARSLVVPGKGILAADESESTIGARFATAGIENTLENRRSYREVLCTATGIGENISGVILNEETLGQNVADGASFSELLMRVGVLPGVKVDKGTASISEGSVEKHTLGLSDLSERLNVYAAQGAVFAKWRAVFSVGDGVPSDMCIQQNALELALYAKMCQTARILPIIEPEVLMDGGHSMTQCEDVTARVLHAVFATLAKEHVALDGMLLKTNMIIPGKESSESVSSEAIAHATVRVLTSVVPEALPGIVFLSGGQSELEATNNLNGMYLLGENVPWRLSFSYGRALQDSALRAWSGREENRNEAQRVFLHRAEMNSLASVGEYELGLETGME